MARRGRRGDGSDGASNKVWILSESRFRGIYLTHDFIVKDGLRACVRTLWVPTLRCTKQVVVVCRCTFAVCRYT